MLQLRRIVLFQMFSLPQNDRDFQPMPCPACPKKGQPGQYLDTGRAAGVGGGVN